MARLLSTPAELEHALSPAVSSLSTPTITNPDLLRHELIDDLIYTAMFAEDEEVLTTSRGLIYTLAPLMGAVSSSIYPLYVAFGEGEVEGFTVPALNIRALTYDTARLIFRLMQQHNIGPVIFEIARSEIEYTHQRPQEYAITILAAAIKEGYEGPVFLQGDHYQFSKNKFTAHRDEEIGRLKDLIAESLAAQFRNIDIDASTLVDLSQEDLAKQQETNADMTALLTQFIRDNQPKDTMVAIGGEIGHIGGKNSTTEDFEAFMQEYRKKVPDHGITKVSVQTGSSHGGTPLPDGSVQEVAIDFSVLKDISTLARQQYHIGGAVQHGASTLQLSAFDHFVESKTLEIHLATGFQNLVYDHMPTDLREEMYAWIKDHLAEERTPEQTEEQFLYKTRKKALGPFKQVLWDLPAEEKEPIIKALEDWITTLFTKLKVFDTRETLLTYYGK